MYHHDWTEKTQTEKLLFFLPIVTPDKMIPVVQGPVVQNIVTLTSSLAVKMLTVLVSTISNSLVFLLKK